MKLALAQDLVACHRTGGEPDKKIAQALEVVRADTASAAELERQLRFDASMAAAIQAIETPADLHKKLAESLGKIQVPKRGLVRQIFHPAVLSVVFGVLFIVGFMVWMWLDGRAAFRGRDAVSQIVGVADDMSGVELQPTSGPAGQLADAFYIRGFEGFMLPAELGSVPAVGSRLFRQNGRQVAQIAIDPHNALVYVFRASDFNVELPEGSWREFTRDTRACAVRVDKGLCTVVAFEGTAADMHRFLSELK